MGNHRAEVLHPVTLVSLFKFPPAENVFDRKAALWGHGDHWWEKECSKAIIGVLTFPTLPTLKYVPSGNQMFLIWRDKCCRVTEEAFTYTCTSSDN